MNGTTDGDTFYDFVQEHLLPHLLPFDGVNPHSVVVLDNCSIHHIQEAAVKRLATLPLCCARARGNYTFNLILLNRKYIQCIL